MPCIRRWCSVRTSPLPRIFSWVMKKFALVCCSIGEMVREAQKILDEIGFKMPAAAMLADLTIGQQQLVATARASTRGTRFLIFDEPTGYLTRQEATQLFALIRRLKAKGVTIVYISHRLEEVFQLADRVSILRDGQLVSTQRVADTNENALIAGMINRSIDQVHYKETIPFGAEILRTENLTGKGFRMSPFGSERAK